MRRSHPWALSCLPAFLLLSSGLGASPKLRGAGYNGDGELGTGKGTADSYLLADVNLTLREDGDILVSMLDSHAIVLNGDPNAATGMTGWIWGSNRFGQLGLSSDLNALPSLSLPTQLSPILFPSTTTGNSFGSVPDVAFVYEWNASCSCENRLDITFSGLMSLKDIENRFNEFLSTNAVSILPDYAENAIDVQLRLSGSRIDVTSSSMLKDRFVSTCTDDR